MVKIQASSSMSVHEALPTSAMCIGPVGEPIQPVPGAGAPQVTDAM